MGLWIYLATQLMLFHFGQPGVYIHNERGSKEKLIYALAAITVWLNNNYDHIDSSFCNKELRI